MAFWIALGILRPSHCLPDRMRWWNWWVCAHTNAPSKPTITACARL